MCNINKIVLISLIFNHTQAIKEPLRTRGSKHDVFLQQKSNITSKISLPEDNWNFTFNTEAFYVK